MAQFSVNPQRFDPLSLPKTWIPAKMCEVSDRSADGAGPSFGVVIVVSCSLEGQISAQLHHHIDDKIIAGELLFVFQIVDHRPRIQAALDVRR